MRSARVVICAVVAAIAVALAPVAAEAKPAPTHAAAAGQISAKALLAGLKVARTDRKHRYRASGFPAVDANANGCSTRAEVLARDDRARTNHVIDILSGPCTATGRWHSLYDGAVSTDPARVTVSHVVPTNEAWRSGAWKWSQRERTAFANDLGYRISLQVVTTQSSKARANRNPARWLPKPNPCAYAKAWIGVKARWHLTVDKKEKAALTSALATCASDRVLAPHTPNLIALTGLRPAPSIWLPKDPTVYFFGDSWTHGTSAAAGRGFPQVVGESLGWDVELGPDNSGAGYVYSFDSSKALLPDSAESVPSIDADLIVLEGGLNDESGDLTKLLPAVVRTVKALREASSHTPIVMVGPASPDGVTPESLAIIDQREQAAARRLGIHYISPVQQRWFTRGNAATLVDQVTFHPNTAGHAYYAGRLVSDLDRFVTTAN